MACIATRPPHLRCASFSHQERAVVPEPVVIVRPRPPVESARLPSTQITGRSPPPTRPLLLLLHVFRGIHTTALSANQPRLHPAHGARATCTLTPNCPVKRPVLRRETSANSSNHRRHSPSTHHIHTYYDTTSSTHHASCPPACATEASITLPPTKTLHAPARSDSSNAVFR